MRSELFEETIKQHKDSLTDELVQLGKHRQAQLAEWDIEQNETDYEFYFDSAWNYQQSKIDELQKRLDASLIAFEKLKEEINELHGQCDLHLIKYLEEKSQVLEQALKGGDQ